MEIKLVKDLAYLNALSYQEFIIMLKTYPEYV